MEHCWKGFWSSHPYYVSPSASSPWGSEDLTSQYFFPASGPKAVTIDWNLSNQKPKQLFLPVKSIVSGVWADCHGSQSDKHHSRQGLGIGSSKSLLRWKWTQGLCLVLLSLCRWKTITRLSKEVDMLWSHNPKDFSVQVWSRYCIQLGGMCCG